MSLTTLRGLLYFRGVNLRSVKKWQAPSIFLFFLVLGVIYSYPLIRYFNNAVPYCRFPPPGREIQVMNMGDHLSLYYNFWLLKDNLMHFRNPFSDPYQFYYWGKKFFNPQIGLFSVLFAIFSPLGNVVAFNLVFLVSFMLAGGVTFLWLRKAGISFWPAMLGGTIYCLAPHRLSQMCGHINGLFYFSFPLLLYFAEGMVESQKKRFPILIGVVLLLMAWTEYHMFYYTALFLIPYGLFLTRRIISPLKKTGAKRYPVVLLSEGVGVGIMVATLASQRGWPYGNYYLTLIPVFGVGFYLLVISLSDILAGFVQTPDASLVRERVAFFLFPLCLFILTPVKLWFPIPQYGHVLLAVVFLALLYNLWRALSGSREFHVHRENLRKVLARFFPILPLLICAGAVVIAIKKLVLGGTIAEEGRGMAEVRYFSPHPGNLIQRMNYAGETMVYLGFLALVLMVVCLGYLLMIRREESEGPSLTSQARFWFGAFLFFTFLSLGLSVSIVPIYAFFYKFVPYFKYPRVPGRIIFISYAAMAFCAAWAIERIRSRRVWVKTGLAILLMAGIFLDYLPPRPLGLCLLDRGKTVYAGLVKKDMPPKTVLELPLWPGDSAWSTIYQYYVTRFRYPMVNGYSPVVPKDYVKEVFYGLYPMDVGEVPPQSLEMLGKLHVKYVVFHTDAYPYKICPFPSWMVLKRLKALPFLKLERASGHKALFSLVKPARGQGIDWHSLEAIDSPVGVLWEAERSRHLIGKVVPDPMASAGKALASLKLGKRGMMMGKQNRFFPPGWYEGVVRIKAWKAFLPGDEATLGAVLITGRHRRNTLTMKVISTSDLIPDTYSDIRFTFHVPHAQKIECVVYSNGTVPLCLDYVFIAFKGKGEGDAMFQAEDLFHQARILPLPSGNGMGVRFTPDIVNNRGITGPLHRLMPGYYCATFWLGVDGKVLPSSPVAIIQVARGHQREVLAERTLKRSDWRVPRALQPFTLKFFLKRPSIMQFPIYYQGKGVLWADRIKVARNPSP